MACRWMMVLAAAPACAWTLTQQIATHAEPRHSTPAMISRRKAELDKELDDVKFYSPEEAISLMKKMANSKFVETAELHGNLNLDPKYNDQQIRTTVALPHGTGKAVRVAVRT